MEYHVAKNGSNKNAGTKEAPFLTIQQAADVMVPGDVAIVHEGVYREWVKPREGGLSATKRIEYRSAEGEKVVIKGSEIVDNWTLSEGNLWKTTVDNQIFGSYNPFATTIDGDWLLLPYEPFIHTAEVYLNGKSMYEAYSLKEAKEAPVRERGQVNPYSYRDEMHPHPEDTVYRWYAEVLDDKTVIYANFQGKNPNEECVEINVRKSCFYPEKTGLNYITVKGFEIAQAATMWAPPTSEQTGIIGPNWSKGWIIEDCHIHDAKCSAICLGKGYASGDNLFTKNGRKPGYQNQLEAVFKDYHMGWNFDTVGGHVVRNNIIHDCGQNGVVGHLGCIGSEIYNNEIYNISTKYEYFGWEVGGIKLHAALDVMIRNNYIHNCVLGTWLDWQAQGVRVSKNIYACNVRDLMVEVSHGPYIVDNNIFASDFAFENASQGGALVNNLFCGFTNRYTVLNRATPYHYPHSTDPLGTALVYGGDDRLALNIFLSGGFDAKKYGTAHYEGATKSLEEYIEKGKSYGRGDVEQYELVKQPVWLRDNAYCGGAPYCSNEESPVLLPKNIDVKLTDNGSEVYLDIEWPEALAALKGELAGTENLGETRISEARFENRDGSDLVLDTDFAGKKREACTHAGPLEGLAVGTNHVLIWSR